VKGEDAAGAGLGIALVAKERLDAGGFVGEGDLFRAGQEIREEVREVFAVVGALLGDGRKRGALLLGLDHAEGNAVDEEEIVAATGL
jgi:hypothetical protein